MELLAFPGFFGGPDGILAKSLAPAGLVVLWCATAQGQLLGAASYLKAHHGGGERTAIPDQLPLHGQRRGSGSSSFRKLTG